MILHKAARKQERSEMRRTRISCVSAVGHAPLRPGFRPSFAKKLLHQLSTLIGEDTGSDFQAVIQPLRRSDAEVRFDGAETFVMRAEDEAGDAGVYKRAGTHGAWLDRRIYGGAREAVIADLLCRLAEGDDLGMGGRVVIGDR